MIIFWIWVFVQITHLVALFLMIRTEVRTAHMAKRVERIDLILRCWAETWGQPPDEVKALLTQMLREPRHVQKVG